MRDSDALDPVGTTAPGAEDAGFGLGGGSPPGGQGRELDDALVEHEDREDVRRAVGLELEERVVVQAEVAG